ncbi:FAD-dependent oxidoreductase [Nocardia bovistercoris]|uniref:ferredoxin--NADP(+) reductase n=1 Tax=Nocardia bovistercoris TaxID=2785916 RepID=A0A931N6Z5_9NOCA|nr:FAD-dependent oxidoreductase [Nocardia bovistercoris]MBH0780218.1 FAD-dependent oxidoreductase [Nocardia bovistercoris]
MAYVITQRCCNDASCVAECPVDCIRPRPDDPQFQTAEMLYIDPETCIDCGACFEACPVGAIYAEDELPPKLERFTEVNAAYFRRNPLESELSPPVALDRLPAGDAPLRVAIVGSGPSACYAAEQLLARGAVEVEMFDRLPTPWGLVRYGVAPDHAETRGVADMFTAAFKRDAVQWHLNVEVGKHISHAELLESHHGVIYAVGASADRRLDIPGEDLPGSHAATDFVAWYNGHPDHAELTFDLTGERAVVVGNGNVALDIARVLTMDIEDLARTDIADHALEALRHSNIREVVVLGRRGPAQAAYTSSELMALAHLRGVDVIVDPAELAADAALAEDPGTDHATALKLTLAGEFARAETDPSHKRIVLRYRASPTEITGTDRVESLTCVRNELVTEADGTVRARATDETETIPAALVIRSVGYRGRPIPDLPFDDARAVVPNAEGRVLDGDAPLPGVYVTGWIKRGPRGVIGSNRADSQQTVAALVADFRAGALPAPRLNREALTALIRERQPEVIDRAGWQSLDRAERAAGSAAGRPRVKLTSVEALLATARRG